MADVEIGDLATVCRACLTKFAEKSVQHPVNELFLTCSGVSVIDDERVPQSLCMGCYRKVELWRKFQMKCQESEHKIWALLNQNYPEQEIVTSSGERVILVAKIEEVEVMRQTVHEKEEVGETEEEEIHETTETHEIEIDHEEEMPQEEEVYEEESKEEIVEEHNPANESLIIMADEEEDGKYILSDQFAYLTLQCPICKEYLHNCHEFNNHLCEVHMDEKDLVCPECQDDEPFDNPDSFSRHIYSHVEFKFVCPICGTKVGSRMNLQAHLRLQHNLKSLQGFRQCHICGEFAKDEHDLKKHLIKEHISANDLSCFMCPSYKAESDRRLAAHLYMHVYAKMKNICCCEICGKVVQSQAALNTHVKQHKETKSEFPCDVCGNVYRSQAYLDDHKLRHTLEKTIKCPECDKKFYVLKQLKTHLKTHGPDNRSYICSYCQRGFFNTSTLKEHVRIRHTQERLYPCDRCDRSYYRNRELIEHQRSHTGEKPFSCSICNRIYARKTTLMTHMKTHRNMTTTTYT